MPSGRIIVFAVAIITMLQERLQDVDLAPALDGKAVAVT
jgi:hypothetical protein